MVSGVGGQRRKVEREDGREDVRGKPGALGTRQRVGKVSQRVEAPSLKGMQMPATVSSRDIGSEKEVRGRGEGALL